jgi:hypothetical protein
MHAPDILHSMLRAYWQGRGKIVNNIDQYRVIIFNKVAQ